MGDNGSLFASPRDTPSARSLQSTIPRGRSWRSTRQADEVASFQGAGGWAAGSRPATASFKEVTPARCRPDGRARWSSAKEPGGEQTPSFPSQSCPPANAQGLWVHTALAPPTPSHLLLPAEGPMAWSRPPALREPRLPRQASLPTSPRMAGPERRPHPPGVLGTAHLRGSWGLQSPAGAELPPPPGLSPRSLAALLLVLSLGLGLSVSCAHGLWGSVGATRPQRAGTGSSWRPGGPSPRSGSEKRTDCPPAWCCGQEACGKKGHLAGSCQVLWDLLTRAHGIVQKSNLSLSFPQ